MECQKLFPRLQRKPAIYFPLAVRYDTQTEPWIRKLENRNHDWVMYR
jgi:hypothetical protein